MGALNPHSQCVDGRFLINVSGPADPWEAISVQVPQHVRPGGHKGTWIVQTLGQAVKFGTANACLRHMSPKEEDTSAQEAAGDCEDRATSSPAARPNVQPQVFLFLREFSSCLLAIHPLALGSDVSVPLSELRRLSCLFN